MSRIRPQHLAELIRTDGPALVLYARQWRGTGDDSLAEDIVQEAFIQLMLQDPAPENKIAWMYRVVRNRAMNASRAAARRTRHETAAAAQKAAWFQVCPEDQLDCRAVEESLQALADDLREIIVARLWGGLTFEEIGELTTSSPATAHRRYTEGLARLRERIGAETTQFKMRE